MYDISYVMKQKPVPVFHRRTEQPSSRQKTGLMTQRGQKSSYEKDLVLI